MKLTGLNSLKNSGEQDWNLSKSNVQIYLGLASHLGRKNF